MSAVIPVQFMTKRPLEAQTVDTRVANCSLWLPNSNCNSNSSYDMPNAQPWTWSGVSGLSLRNPGYDFVGGTTIGYQNLTSSNDRNYSTTSTPILGPVQQTNRNFNNCNCNTGYGAGVYNCYSNCNCNCACACDCSNCNCDCGK